MCTALLFIACPSSDSGEGGGESGQETVPTASVGDFTVGATSVQMAQNMAIGWNLGNTLDATAGDNEYTRGLNTETAWGMPKTTKAMITAVKNAGFKTIRIPVSWHDHITDSNYTIDSAWMARVKEVVDYAYSQNMCVIINVHHDNFSISDISSNYGYALSTDSSIQTKSKAYLQKVWTQIATTFATYDQKLVFELLNEPRDVGGKVWGNEWWISDNNATTINSIITAYEQTSLGAIRAVSGNENRYLMAPAYAGSSGWVTKYSLPTDTASDKLILSFHAYSPYNFAMSGSDTTFTESHKSELNSMFSKVHNAFPKIGIVIGEASCTNKGNLAEREKWFTYYFGTAYSTYGMPTVLWDNMVETVDCAENNPYDGKINGEHHGYLNRKSLEWYFPTLITNAMKAVYGSDYAGS